MQTPLTAETRAICQREDQSLYLRHVVNDMSNAMADRLSGAVERSFTPIAQQMNAFIAGQTQTQLESLNMITRRFLENMNLQLGGQFQQLGQTLTDDTTLLAVYAPLENHPKTDWLGLGGYTHTYRGQTFYMAEFSSAFAAPESGRWERNGIRYDLGTCALVHEILHAVELNSRNNGWSGFEMLHDAGPNGYDDQKAFMDWYGDLMTDRLKNGKAGFRAVSFYVKHDPGMRARAGNP